MALAVAQSKIADGTAGTTIALAFDSNTTAGSLIVAVCASQSGTFTSVTDTQSNSYSQFFADAAPGTRRTAVYYAMNTAGGACTVTLTVGSASDLILSLYEVTGAALTSAADVYVWLNDTDFEQTSTSGNTAATAQADEIVFGVCTGGKVPTDWAMSGYTEQHDSNGTDLGVCTGYKIVSAAGAQVANWTHYSQFMDRGAGCFTFKQAAAATPPVAAFSADVTSGDITLAVTFTDASTNTPTSWDWDFGDGGTSTSQSPSHNYTVAGTYDVSLVATNAAGSDEELKLSYITASTPNVTGTLIPATITVGSPGGKGTKGISKRYPVASGLTAGSTKQAGTTGRLIPGASYVPRRARVGL